MRGKLIGPDYTASAVPAIILGLAGGCAVGVLVGEGTGQLKNLVKHGRIDDATDIALGATVDCIIGAVPGAWAKAAFSKVVTKATSKIRVIIKETIRRLWG